MLRQRVMPLPPWWPLAVAAAGYAALAIVYLRAAGWNFTFFVHFAPDYRITQHFGGAAAGLYTAAADVHDGVAYYAIAREPFNLPLLGQILDTPIIRYRRILYPLVVHLASFGHAGLVAPMLLVVNLLATLAGGYALAWLVRPFELPPGWTLLYYFHPGLLLSFLYDLPTAPALLGLIVGLSCYARGRILAAAVSLSFALLTWEVVVWPVVIGLLAHAVLRRWRNRTSRFPRVLLLPVAVVIAWELLLISFFGAAAVSRIITVNLGLPFVGWWLAWRHLVEPPWSAAALFPGAFLALLGGGVALAFVRWFRTGQAWAISAMAQAVLVLSLNVLNLGWPLEYTRKTMGLWVLLFLGFAQHRDRATQFVVLGTTVTTLLVWPWLPPLPAAR